MKIHKRDEIYIDHKDHFGDYGIAICEWYNGEGLDVTIDTKGVMQTYSFTYPQFDAINALVQCLKSGISMEDAE